MRFSTVALLGVLSSCATTTSAWTSSSSSLARAALRSPTTPSTTSLWSTLEKPSATAIDDSALENLSPEYAAVLTHTRAKLQASIPEKYASTMLPLLDHFLCEYMTAHQDAVVYNDKKKTASDDDASSSLDPTTVATRFLTGIGYGLRFGLPGGPDHYTFDVSHEALRNGIPDDDDDSTDYYQFGCDFFRDCMALTAPDVNVIGHDTHLQQAVDQLAAGENVVFLANHQSEADPQVVSACFDLAGQSKLAADTIYVAGHKVTTDPLAIPFSMGRNLLCIHSKKHMEADPDTKPMKQRQNLKAMNALLKGLKQGGTAIWVAPSGGRDRRDVSTGEVPLAPFDRKTLDMFRLMGNKSKVPTHYYTLAMVSYDLCPPPDFVEAGTGESRNVRHSAVGIAVGEELESVGGLEARQAFNTKAMEQCQQDYDTLLEVLKE